MHVTQEAGDSPRTPMMRKKKSGPSTPQSSSARHRITAETPCSPAVRRALKYSDNNENTPPRPLRENNPANVGESPRVNKHPKQGPSPAKSDLTSSQCSKESPGGAHKRSTSVDIRKMQSMFKTAAEDNIKSIRNYVTDLKERVAKLQYQKQLLVCQVLFQTLPAFHVRFGMCML
jgi:centromeric protein E